MILIVDDKEANLFALENTLKRLDVPIVRASSGSEALRASLDNDFALAILDVRMPEMDGYELAALLRGDERSKNIPIIFLSAEYSDEPAVFRGYESGGVDFIIKPFNPAILISKVKVFLDLYEHKTEIASQKAKLEQTVSQLKNQIEQRRSAERVFQELAAIVEHSDDFIIGKTLSGIITSWNSAAEKIYGYSFDEVKGRPVSILVPDDRHDEIPSILERIKQGEKVDIFETVRMRKNGEKIHVSLTISPTKDPSGKVIGASTIGRDITEKKITARQLVDEKVSLQETVKIRTAELVRTNKILEQEIIERKELESRMAAGNFFLKLLNEAKSRKEYLDATVEKLLELTGCSCIGIRVLGLGGDVPYESYSGYPGEFWEEENKLILSRDNCACTRVITGNIEPQDRMCMTPGGLFTVAILKSSFQDSMR